MKITSKISSVFPTLSLAIFIIFASVALAFAQPSQVWVDDDYCQSCQNDGHTWDEDAFDTIQNGIDAVTSPGTVHVAEGNYQGKVVLKTQVSLLGAGKGASVIDGMGLKVGEEDRVVAMASGSKISGFSITNGGWNGVECRGVSAVIEGNLIAHHEAIGIHLIGYGSRDSIVKNNIVTDCASYLPKLLFVGAIFGNTVYGSPQIVHNTVVGNHYVGIGFCHPGTPIIKNNIVVGNDGGIGVCGNTDPINSHNNSWNNGPGNWIDIAPGEGAISSDPLFANEIEGDYHLEAGSPCINQGTDVGVYTDMDGDVRPIGAKFDIGADEYLPDFIEIELDIRPGTSINTINLVSKGMVPVAILTTDNFCAYDVKPASCLFAGAFPRYWEMKNVDYDVDYDILLYYKTKELNLTKDSTEAAIEGTTYDGIPIMGADSVNIIP